VSDPQDETTRPRTCEWQLDDIGGDSVWDTQCNHQFYFDGADGPKDAGFTHCPFCGSTLIETHSSDKEEPNAATV
jgi:hypothetical protein